MKTIAQLLSGETMKHTGDLIIEGDVGSGSSIDLTDGALTINGNVGEGARIAVQISEALRHSNATSIKISKMNVSFPSRTGDDSNISADVTMDINGKDYRSGNVNIENRIFTHDQVHIRGPDEYLIHRYVNHGGPSGPRMFFGNVNDYNDDTVTATIDGVNYTGKEILVKGKKVTVDNQNAPTVNASSSSSQQSEPRMPLKVIIKGQISDYVKLNADTQIEANSIGKECTIVSKYHGITAANIGERTQISARNSIKLNEVGNGCIINSTHYGLEAKTLGQRTQVKVREEIDVSTVGDFSDVTSLKLGIKAEHIGQNVVINVHDSINVAGIGNNSTLTSSQGGLDAEEISNIVTIHVRESVNVKSIGTNCSVTSSQKGITVAGAVATLSSLEAREDISVNSSGDGAQIKSNNGRVTVTGSLGDHIQIDAKGDVDLENVGQYANISSSRGGVSIKNIGINSKVSARDQIIISGTCPEPNSLKLSTTKKNGTIKWPQRAVPVNATPQLPNTAGYVTGSYEDDLAMAIEASKATISNQSSSSSASKLGIFAANQIKVPKTYKCPISQELMQDPVLCSLDGYTYERKNIMNQLTAKGCTPVTNKGLAPNQTIESVLIPNVALKNEIAEFINENKPNSSQFKF